MKVNKNMNTIQQIFIQPKHFSKSEQKFPVIKIIIHHFFELVLSRMQGLSDALRQQDLVSQSLLPKRHSTTGDNHHLPALILQHGHLKGHTKP